MKNTFTFTGGREIAKALDQMSKALSSRIKLEALREAGEPMRYAMQQKAPRATGKLQGAMVINNSRGQDAKESAVAIGPARGSFYGSFAEFGTKEIAAQPFIRPSFDETAQETLHDLSDILWRELSHRNVTSRSMDLPVEGEES